MTLDGSENKEVNIEGLPEYQMPSAFVTNIAKTSQDNKYVLDDDDKSEKDDEDKGNVENEKEFEILIYSDVPITID